MNETWLILGGSSGLGRAIAREAAARGYSVLLAGRDLEDLKRSAADLQNRFGVEAGHLAFDATATSGHRAFVQDVRKHLKGSLTVVLAFALMLPQLDAERDPEVALQMIQAGYTGAVSILLHLIPVFEMSRHGRVVVIGSVAGDRGRRSNYVYGSIKAGLATFTEGLRARLFQAGVSVTLIKPGFLDTAMTWQMPASRLTADPARAAARIVRAAERRRHVVYVPFIWWGIMQIIKTVPAGLMKRLSI
jgi:short-subunit dehydrogenase